MLKCGTMKNMESPLGEMTGLLLYFMALTLLVYAMILGYHWLTYGADRKSAFLALTVYGVGAGVLLLGMIIAYNFF